MRSIKSFRHLVISATGLACLSIAAVLLSASFSPVWSSEAKKVNPLALCQGSVERLDAACRTYVSTNEKIYISDKEISNLPFDVTNGILKAAGKEPQDLHSKGKKLMGETFFCPDGGHYLISLVSGEVTSKCDKHGTLAEIRKSREAEEKKSLYIKIGLGVAGVLILMMILR